jgi:dolichol-phosphate mannosyltransferase
MKTLSIVVPAYNEEENLPLLFLRVNKLFADKLSHYNLEAIILDNASSDRTEEIACSFCARDSRWKYIRYSRNFGADVSMTAGLDFAQGDAVINLFSDLQDPPEKIPDLVAEWEKGAEVVNGVVMERNDSSFIKTLGARIAYKLIFSLSECKLQPGATDFRLLDRKVVEVLKRMRERDRYMRGLVGWVGFRRTTVPYNRSSREHGVSNAGIINCIYYALHAIVCFSGKPLQFATYFGFGVTFISLLLGFLYLVLFFVHPSFMAAASPGITTIILLVAFGLGIQSLFLGLIGEYLARVYNQGKGRPLYVVDQTVGID